MSNNKNWNHLGDEFVDAVSNAINKGDFKKLNYLVTDTVTDVIAEASVQVKKAGSEIQKEFQNTSRNDVYKNAQQYQQQQRQRNQAFQQNRPTSVVTTRKHMPVSKAKNVGQVSSILYMVFGGIGTGFTVLALFIGLIFTVIDWSWSAGVYIFLFAVLFLFLCMIYKGNRDRKRLGRMKRYISLCDDNMYVNIKFLAQQTGKDISYVLKDVKKMLELGFFPEGHLDEKGTCLMLDDNTYREYLRVENERKALEQEEARRKATPLSEEEKYNQELQSIMHEGQDYIQKLHHLNDLIEDEVVSQKLYRMEDLLKEIFRRLKEAPEQMPKMRKLMNYYLPTTIKLLQAYSEFDDVTTPNQDIASAKAEIEKTIDIINEAFTELLNKLFQDSAFDAATDAQVLQTMLAREGLTKNKVMEENRNE